MTRTFQDVARLGSRKRRHNDGDGGVRRRTSSVVILCVAAYSLFAPSCDTAGQRNELAKRANDISNAGVSWVCDYTGAIPSVTGANERWLLTASADADEYLLLALSDPDRWVTAHVLLSCRHWARFPCRIRGLRWNGLEVDFDRSMGARFDDAQRHEIRRVWYQRLYDAQPLSEAQVPQAYAMISNAGISWQWEEAGFLPQPKVVGVSEGKLLGPKIRPEALLLTGLDDPSKWIAAHVLLVLRHEHEPLDLCRFDVEHWAGLRVVRNTDGSPGIDEAQRVEIRDFWRRSLTVAK